MSERAALRSYLTAASEAEQASIKEYHGILEFVERLNTAFRIMVSGTAYSEHPSAGFLSTNSHANFLAAVSSALRGQSPPTFMILRGCVESAMYAFLIGHDKKDGDVWMDRRKNPDAMKAKFSANRAIQRLEKADKNLAAMARDTYEWMIEFGGHPNPRSVVDHIRFNEEDEEGNHAVSHIYIHSGDSLAVLRALSACVENGCMALAMIVHSMPKHPQGDAVFDEAWSVFHGFQKFLAAEGYIDEVPTFG